MLKLSGTKKRGQPSMYLIDFSFKASGPGSGARCHSWSYDADLTHLFLVVFHSLNDTIKDLYSKMTTNQSLLR